MMFTSLNQNVLSMASADTGARAGAFSVWVNQNHSRSVLTLASTDPAVHPPVHERMLSDERDLARLREGVRALVELARNDPQPRPGAALERRAALRPIPARGRDRRLVRYRSRP